jgi:hydroxymethylpyrimidine/phosphomethylpyrimidine kinase
VVDPVAVSQSGHRLLQENAVRALKRDILPLADLLTPNKPEAEMLSGRDITDPASLEKAGRDLLAMGAKAVLIKGGHFAPHGVLGNTREELTDWLCLPGKAPQAFSHPRAITENNHGTGCTFSAALATFLGRDIPLTDAVTRAQHFLGAALAASYAPGLGAGPPNFPAGASALV